MAEFRTRFWAEMTWPEFAALDMAEAIAVLPVAAIEQHGPHLPVGVDSFIMEGYLRQAVNRVPSDLPVLFLPLQPIGTSVEHRDYPGTLTLSAQTIISAWTEIGESVRRAGCRKLVIINSHGGNIPVIDIVARDLRVRHRMLVVTASWHRFGYPDGLFSAVEQTHGIHAGDAETSLMLAFRPEQVQRERVRNFVPATVEMEQNFTWLRGIQPIGFGWMSQDLSAPGAMGNAAEASAAKGETAADYGVTAFVELLRDVEAFDLSHLAPGPLGS
jgi:creatinine amidohydrolase